MSNRLDASRYGKGNAVMAASRQVWLAGLGAAVVTREWAEREAGNVFRTLVAEGTAVESRTIRLLGDGIETSFSKASSVLKATSRNVANVVTTYTDTALALVRHTAPMQAVTRASRPVKRVAKKAPQRAVKRTKRATKRSTSR